MSYRRVLLAPDVDLFLLEGTDGIEDLFAVQSGLEVYRFHDSKQQATCHFIARGEELGEGVC
jgi:hypothetical protein